jgi:hypothetical protein
MVCRLERGEDVVDDLFQGRGYVLRRDTQVRGHAGERELGAQPLEQLGVSGTVREGQRSKRSSPR